MVVHDLAKILFSVLDNHRALKSLIKAGATLFFFRRRVQKRYTRRKETSMTGLLQAFYFSRSAPVS